MGRAEIHVEPHEEFSRSAYSEKKGTAFTIGRKIKRKVYMTTPRPGKGYYNEAQAAAMLGISLAQLRVLVRRHILETEDDLVNLPITSFQPSDLLLLRLLAGHTLREEPVTAG